LNAVIDVVAPVFGLGLIGYIAARLGFFSENMAQGLARFVFDYAVPLLLVRMFSAAHLPDQVPLELWAGFYAPVLGVYALGMLLAARQFDRNFMEQTIAGFGCAFGNTVLLGLPLVLLYFGDDGVVPFFILISVHGLSLFTVTTVLLEFGRNSKSSLQRLPFEVLKGLVKNPIIVGIAIGLILNRTATPLPGPIDRIAESMQQAVTPCALFSLGASLTRYGFAGRLQESLQLVAVKTLLMPALVWFLTAVVFELSPLVAMVATLTAAQPVGVNVYLFAQRYESARALATTSVFLSTVFSMISLPILLYLFQDVTH
jgi:predicted permease